MADVHCTRDPLYEKTFPQHVLIAAERFCGANNVYSLFRMAGDVTRYSSLMPWHWRDHNTALWSITKSGCCQGRWILDATAHVGVDSANLAITFPDAAGVCAVEVDTAFAKVLAHNVSTLQSNWSSARAHIEVEQGNGVNRLLTLAPDGQPWALAFLDPPWGGPSYKDATHGDVRLELMDAQGQGWTMPDLVHAALEQGSVELVVLKAPLNYARPARACGAYTVHVAAMDGRQGKASYRLYTFRRVRKTPYHDTAQPRSTLLDVCSSVKLSDAKGNRAFN